MSTPRPSAPRPLFETFAEAGAPKPLGATLRAIATAPATSPWSPGAQNTPAQLVDTRAIEDEARERGREQGLAETAELRARLAKSIEQFTAARDALRAPAADRITSVALAVIDAWTKQTTPRDLYEPIITAWLAKHTGPATAQVAPAHLAAFRDLLGESPITVEADHNLRAGDIRLSAPTMELSYSWANELDSLRLALEAALEGSQ